MWHEVLALELAAGKTLMLQYFRNSRYLIIFSFVLSSLGITLFRIQHQHYPNDPFDRNGPHFQKPPTTRII